MQCYAGARSLCGSLAECIPHAQPWCMLEVLSFWSSCSQPLKVGGIRPHHNHRSQSPLSEDARALAPCGGGKDTAGTLESVDEGEARRLCLWGWRGSPIPCWSKQMVCTLTCTYPCWSWTQTCSGQNLAGWTSACSQGMIKGKVKQLQTPLCFRLMESHKICLKFHCEEFVILSSTDLLILLKLCTPLLKFPDKKENMWPYTPLVEF